MHEKRFQLDAQWQCEFGLLVKALEDCREHTAAGCQLRDAGVMDEARYQLELADEAKERADLLEHALRRPMSIDIETIDQMIERGYTVSTFCPRCGRRGPDLDLQKYAARGKGSLRPAQLYVRHKWCRTELQITIHPPLGPGGDRRFG